MSTPAAATVPVIIVDDGELVDVRQLLAQLDVAYRDETSLGSGADGAPCGLLITSARRALAAENGGAREADRPCKLHVVVYDTMSRTLRRVLAQSGCDVVIGRPVHPAVLNLLVSHALYSGPERRTLGRTAMAAPVKLLVDRSAREATLVQLSLRGCGLASSQRAEIGQQVEVILPPGLTSGEALTLAGHVVAAGPATSDGGRGCDISVRFRSTQAAVRAVLCGVMERHGLGATVTPARTPPSAPAETPETAAEVASDTAGGSAASGADQRSGPRKLFPRRVLAAADGGTQVLIGRDLSVGGMRVRPVPGLRLGDEFKLVLYGTGEQPALMVKAVVGRDDGWDGLVLHFRDLGSSVAARLERLVASLPAARPTKGAEARAPGVVVSEIVERE